MATPRTFDLNIAVLGNAKAGKKTVVDSLLRHDSCSSSTAAAAGGEEGGSNLVLKYAILSGQNADKENNVSAYNVEATGNETVDLGSSLSIVENKFTACTEEPIVPMRDDTTFNFVIVPPVDQTGCEEYIAAKWESWDTVIVVLDGGKGWSDDDTQLLKHIKTQCEVERKQVIVLCNKIDDNESERLGKHVKKAASKVKKIFGEEVDVKEPSSHLCFIAMSAVQSLVYRVGARMTVEEFASFDQDLLAVVGKDHFGSKNWKKFTDDEKFRKTHATIAEPKNYESGIVDCGFKEFMTRFYFCIGGPDKQKELIQARIDKDLSKITPFQTEWISYSMFTIYAKQSKLLYGKNNEEELKEKSKALAETFWSNFDEYQEKTFKKFVVAFPHKAKAIADLIQELMYFRKLVDVAGWDDEREKIKQKMIDIAKKYLVFLIKTEKETSGNTVWNKTSNVSPMDWSIIWRSILVLRYNKLFVSMFPKLIMIIEELAQEAVHWKTYGLETDPSKCPHCFETMDQTKKTPSHLRCKPCGFLILDEPLETEVACAYCGNEEVSQESPRCPNCKYTHTSIPNYKQWLEFSYDDDGNVVPSKPDNYSKIVHLEIPANVSDPNHFAHPIAKICDYIANDEQKKETSEAADQDASKETKK